MASIHHSTELVGISTRRLRLATDFLEKAFDLCLLLRGRMRAAGGPDPQGGAEVKGDRP